MERIRSTKLLDAVVLAATDTYDFDMPAGATGVLVEVKTASHSSLNGTVSVGHLWEDDTTTALITSGAITGNTVTRVAVLPGVVAQANIIANEAMGPRGRFTYTRTAGSATFTVTLHFFR